MICLVRKILNYKKFILWFFYSSFNCMVKEKIKCTNGILVFVFYMIFLMYRKLKKKILCLYPGKGLSGHDSKIKDRSSLPDKR